MTVMVMLVVASRFGPPVPRLPPPTFPLCGFRRLPLPLFLAVLSHMSSMTCSMLVARLLILALRIRIFRVPSFLVLDGFSALPPRFVPANGCLLRRLGCESLRDTHNLSHHVKGWALLLDYVLPVR